MVCSYGGEYMSYKIGSFNMRNIGTAALGEKNERNLQLIAKIIRDNL